MDLNVIFYSYTLIFLLLNLIKKGKMNGISPKNVSLESVFLLKKLNNLTLANNRLLKLEYLITYIISLFIKLIT